MTQSVTHLAQSAAFTPSGGSVWNITDLVDLNDGESCNEVDLTTDASQTVNGMYVDSIKGEISITSKDLANIANAGCVIGATGSLTIRYGKRTAGKGFVAGAYIPMIYANSQLRRITKNAGVTGDGTFTAVFGAYDPAGSSVRSVTIGA